MNDVQEKLKTDLERFYEYDLEDERSILIDIITYLIYGYNEDLHINLGYAVIHQDPDRIYLFFKNNYFHKVEFNDKDIRLLLCISNQCSGVMEYFLEQSLEKGETNFVDLFFNYNILKENIDITSIFRLNAIHLLKRMYSEGIKWNVIESIMMKTNIKLSPEIIEFLEEYINSWEEGSFDNNEIKPAKSK